MSQFAKQYLFWSGVTAMAGALLHVAILIGGPDWYAFFGAPDGIVQMARSGNPRAAITCLVIATILATISAYAFSGAGTVRRLPFLRIVLAVIAGGLLLRGVTFIPLILWHPSTLAGICNCGSGSVSTFIVVTSVICLVVGGGYAVGAWFLGSSRATAQPGA
jgi:hypothetical protein